MDSYKIPLGVLGERFIDFMSATLDPVFLSFAFLVETLVDVFDGLFGLLPAVVWLALITALAWRLSGRGIAIFALVSIAILINQGLWDETVDTLALVLTATIMSLLVAFPLGIVMGESRAVEAVLEPVLDFIQTMPRFVYLIPAVVLLGIDIVPAVFATMTLAVPPPARITAVGLKRVDPDVIEAAEAFGAGRLQILTKIRLPLSLPSLVLAVNQCLMMSLSMVVIASLIGAGGLGGEVLNGIAMLNAGQGFVAGLGIFVIAILIDRNLRSAVARFSDRKSAATEGYY